VFLNEIYVKKHVKRDPFDDFNWLNYCVCEMSSWRVVIYIDENKLSFERIPYAVCIYNVKFVRIHMIKLSLVIVLTAQ